MAGVAVVTGAGRGFGREIAKRLAGRGYAVLATDLDGEAAAATAEAIGGFSMQLDVRDPEAHRRVARAAIERGPLEVWVNNAGVLRTRKAWDHPDDEVRLEVDVNLYGVIWGSRAAVDAMRERGGQNMHVINLGSMSAFTPSTFRKSRIRSASRPPAPRSTSSSTTPARIPRATLPRPAMKSGAAHGTSRCSAISISAGRSVMR